MLDIFRRRRLPHWDIEGATYFITSCLAGNIPSQGLLDIESHAIKISKEARPPQVSEADWQMRCWKLAFARTDDWLDSAPAVRHLEDPRLANKVVDAIFHFAGQRYDLFAYVVMPSHFHWLFKPLAPWVQSLGPSVNEHPPRERIMHSLKRYTANECNQLLGRLGTFWQDESYDHCVRDSLEFERIIRYIENNPVKAGLVSSPELWPYSSAAFRKQHSIPFGQPLVRLS